MMNSVVSRDMVPPCGLSGDSHGVIGHPVVAIPQRYNVEVSSVQPGYQHGQIVGFRSTVDEVNDLKLDIFEISAGGSS